jgi:uncharacterized protein YyaL (SSP411 family)
MPNRLASASSPYLRSHADNPVDWYPWGPEPFAEARRRDVPVLVSIGYSTCHWCHVMARESFSDPELAAQLNADFVAIKVDREEYPDVDATYIAAASAFTPELGWPLNVFVTPGGGPFYGGTYWPPQPVLGHPAFRDVLSAVTDAWNNRRHEVLANASSITTALADYARPEGGELVTDFAPLIDRLAAIEDPEFGGFGDAPKFPVAPAIGFLLDAGAEGLARRTLDAMAHSALRDPVDGGFFRYATRRDWTEPHYERMLYDNALLLDAYARIGSHEVADGIARFLTTTLRLDAGAFASAQDSESVVDGIRVEGTYYELDPERRAMQPAPALDAKVLTGWNGLAIGALARTGHVAEARAAADYLIATHLRDGVLARTSIDGQVSPAPATLEDYGMLASGLLALAVASGEVRYAEVARTLVEGCLVSTGSTRGVSTGSTGAFAVPGGPEPMLARFGLALETDPSEGAYPSGLSAMAGAAHTLWMLTSDSRYRAAAETAMASIAPLAVDRPLSFGASLSVMVALAAPPVQLVVVSAGDDELTAFAREWRRPGAIASIVTEQQARAFEAAGFELFAGRSALGNRTTAYACREFVCDLPVHSVGELRLP